MRRGFLGINPQDITPQIARLNKIPDGQGVLVREVTSENSPAAIAGIQSGDIVVSINNQKVKTTRELIRRVASLPVGSVAAITFVRAGESRTVNVKLEERQEDGEIKPTTKPPFDPRNPRGVPDKNSRSEKAKPTLGLNVRTLTADLAKLHGLEGAHGVLVMSIDNESVADDNGVFADDLIVEINNRPIASAEDFQRALRALRTGDDVVMKVLRKDRSPIRRAWIVSFTMP